MKVTDGPGQVVVWAFGAAGLDHQQPAARPQTSGHLTQRGLDIADHVEDPHREHGVEPARAHRELERIGLRHRWSQTPHGPLEHWPREVDTGNLDPSFAQPGGDEAGADTELEHPIADDQRGQDLRVPPAAAGAAPRLVVAIGHPIEHLR